MDLEICITDVNSANAKDKIYKLDFSSKLDSYRVKGGSQLTRKYSDFVWLQQELQQTHPENIVPPVPLQKATSYSTLSSTAVDQRLKLEIQRFVDKLVKHKTFLTSPVLMQFLESGNDFVPLVNKSGKSGGVSSFFKNVAKSVKPTKETDMWFETHKVDISSLSTYVNNCCKGIDKVSKSRKALGLSCAEFGIKMGEIGGGETNTTLCIALRKFGTAMEKVGNNYSSQSECDSLQMSDSLSLFSKLCESADKTFDNRSAVLADFEDACKNTLKKKQACEKLKTASQVRHDKIESAVAELSEAQTAETQAKELLDQIGKSIKETEWSTFVDACNDDIYTLLSEYCRAQLDVEGRILNEFATIVADIDGISVVGDSSAVAQPVSSSLATEKIAAEVL